MKRTLRAALALALCAPPVRAAEREVHLNHEFAATHNDVTGRGAASSSLTGGWRYIDTLIINASGKAAGWSYGLNTGIKVTDDLRNDPKTWSLTNAQGRVARGAHTVMLGDTFESYSQYALATPLKGASYRFGSENPWLPEVTGVYGVAVPRWDSFWRETGVATVRRQGGGARVKQALSSDAWVGVSALTAKDLERKNTTDSLYNAKNLTFDASYNPIPGLTASAEHSVSKSQFSADDSVAYRDSKGLASRLELVGDGGPSRVALVYENVRPSFYSAFGSATPDRRKFKGSWRYKPVKRLTLNSSLLWFRNNLDGRLSGTTKSWKPELSATLLKPLPSRAFSAVDFAYRFDRRYGTSQSSSDHYFSAGYRDRVRSVDSNTTLGYTRYRTKAAVRDSDEVLANTSLNSRIEAGDYALRPSAQAGFWYSRDELAFTTDKMYDYSVGIGFDAPLARLTSDVRAGENTLKKEAGDSSTKTFASAAVYWKPPFPAKYGTHTLFARGLFNGYAFSTDSRNFRETSVTCGVSTEF
ncbi:MAG: hypothetical protein FD126_1350 [Elusimicrobia bacterium]|nr:MAG: hypothetical protein FD126_1350 [Elusimicrobiota bacterium]